MRAKLLLQVQIVIFYVRSLDVPVKGKDVALEIAIWVAVKRDAWNVSVVQIHGGRIEICHLHGCNPDGVVSRPGRVESRVRQMSQHHVLRERIKEQSITSAQDGLPFTGRVPGNAYARREVFLVGLIQARQPTR